MGKLTHAKEMLKENWPVQGNWGCFVVRSVINRTIEPSCPSTEEWIQEIWCIYTMEYYSDIKNNAFRKFLGKWMALENIILSEVTQSQKQTHGIHSQINGY